MSLKSRLEHPSFPQPEDPNVNVWRYMDLSKFIWLLSERKLYFSRVDLLQDPFEGSSTRKTLDSLRVLVQSIHPEAWNNFSMLYRESRTKMYVNCWYCGDSESEAMWKLYCPNGNGIAIQCSYRRLAESIEADDQIFIGRVTYVDYENYYFPDANLYSVVMHKRAAFSHENEVRLVKRVAKGEDSDQPLGITIEWDPMEHVSAVFVDPYASEYHFDAVSVILKSLSPEWSVPLNWSQIKACPVFG